MNYEIKFLKTQILILGFAVAILGISNFISCFNLAHLRYEFNEYVKTQESNTNNLLYAYDEQINSIDYHIETLLEKITSLEEQVTELKK